jgi:hypothetical protein
MLGIAVSVQRTQFNGGRIPTRGRTSPGSTPSSRTCEARDINPFRYLADVIARVQDHPATKLDELRPGARLKAQAT